MQAIGLTKGGRNSKIHAIVDEFLRPWVLILTPGNTADCIMAQECVSLIPGIKELLADKGYDTDAFRAFLKQQKIRPVIPGKSNRKKRIRHDRKAYKNRNVIERCFGRLKDFRRIATRYDKLAQNFFSALCFVTILAYWIFSIRAVVVKRFQANNSNFCRSRARASLRDQPLALPAWDQQEETEQSDSRTDRGRAIDTRVQSELVSSIVPRGTSLRWIVAPTVWRSSLRLSAPFPLSSGTRFHHSTCDA